MVIEFTGFGVMDGMRVEVPEGTQRYQKECGLGFYLEFAKTDRVSDDGVVIFEFIEKVKYGPALRAT